MAPTRTMYGQDESGNVYKTGPGFIDPCSHCGEPAPERNYRIWWGEGDDQRGGYFCPNCGEQYPEERIDPPLSPFWQIAKIGGIIVIAVIVLFVVFNSCRSCADLCEGKRFEQRLYCMETCNEQRDDAWRYGS